MPDNDTSKVPGGDSGVFQYLKDSAPANQPEVEDPRDKIVRRLQAQGLSTTAIAALVGNMEVETGGQFQYDTIEQGTVEGDTPARGLFQFESDGLGLQQPYNQYLKDTQQEDSAESQLQFIVDIYNDDYDPGEEWVGRGNIQKFRDAVGTNDIQRATEEFSNNILRPGTPHLDRRTEAAQRAYQDFFEQTQVPDIEKTADSLEDSLGIRQRRRGPRHPVEESTTEQIANIGKAGAKWFGGLSPIDKAAVGTTLIPVLGEVVGLVADIEDIRQNGPSWLNVTFAAAGLIPFVPRGQAIKKLFHGSHADNTESILRDGLLANKNRDPESRGQIFLTPKPDAAHGYAVMAGGEEQWLDSVMTNKLPKDVPAADRAVFQVEIPEEWYNKHVVRENLSDDNLVPEVSFDTDIPPEFITKVARGEGYFEELKAPVQDLDSVRGVKADKARDATLEVHTQNLKARRDALDAWNDKLNEIEIKYNITDEDLSYEMTEAFYRGEEIDPSKYVSSGVFDPDELIKDLTEYQALEDEMVALRKVELGTQEELLKYMTPDDLAELFPPKYRVDGDKVIPREILDQPKAPVIPIDRFKDRRPTSVVTFHGTSNSFNVFKVGGRGSEDRLDHGWYGEGVYLTGDHRVAGDYADERNLGLTDEGLAKLRKRKKELGRQLDAGLISDSEYGDILYKETISPDAPILLDPANVSGPNVRPTRTTFKKPFVIKPYQRAYSPSQAHRHLGTAVERVYPDESDIGWGVKDLTDFLKEKGHDVIIVTNPDAFDDLPDAFELTNMAKRGEAGLDWAEEIVIFDEKNLRSIFENAEVIDFPGK